MHVFLKIVGEAKEPVKLEYHGNYSIEIMIFKVTERYYGKEVGEKIRMIIQGEVK
jgi:hypothetical protein